MNLWPRHICMIVVIAAMGGIFGAFLGFAAEGIAGGGHGWVLPMLCYLGIAALLPPSSALTGGILYAAIAVIVATAATRGCARPAVLFVLLLHYMSFLIAACVVYGIDVAEIGEGFDKSWKSMHWWIVTSVTAYIVLNIVGVLYAVGGVRRAGRQNLDRPKSE